MAKKVTVWISSHPLSGEWFSEGLRMSVGLTIAENEVKVIISKVPEEGFKAEQAGVPDHDLHLRTLLELGVKVFALQGEAKGVERIGKNEAEELLKESDVVIFY